MNCESGFKYTMSELDNQVFTDFSNMIASDPKRWRVNGNGYRVPIRVAYKIMNILLSCDKEFSFQIFKSWYDMKLIELRPQYVIIKKEVVSK